MIVYSVVTHLCIYYRNNSYLFLGNCTCTF